MIDKLYNGIIEQVYRQTLKGKASTVMASYTNDFSVATLDVILKYSQNAKGVYFAWKELGQGQLIGAYDPVLDIICDIFRQYGDGDFKKFLDECGVYSLQKPTLLSFYETGICHREESLLLDEVEYERERMTQGLTKMIAHLARKTPIVIVINRFQLASPSTMELVYSLMEAKIPSLGIVLGASGVRSQEDELPEIWEDITESLEDLNLRYHIGNSGISRCEQEQVAKEDFFEQCLQNVTNTMLLLDFKQSLKVLQNVEQMIRFEGTTVKKELKLELYICYAQTCLYSENMSKALEIIDEVSRMNIPGKESRIRYYCAFLAGTCYMYQGKLERAQEFAKVAQEEARRHSNTKAMFRAQLLEVQARMSGWYNIFFCLTDLFIEPDILEKLIEYNYKNYLAHVYIYAYDNRPETIAKAYRTEAALVNFSRGVTLAKEIGNTQLVCYAYQKNVMLASTNGMNEIALLYSVRTYEVVRDIQGTLRGRIMSAIAYNLSALGYNELAQTYYDASIKEFYILQRAGEIAEVFYNKALNNILLGEYKEALEHLEFVMKVIYHLHLNSLRVCNLSKLYALLALSSILDDDIFNAERYLRSCSQFLDYVIIRQKERMNDEVMHDFVMFDDDLFLFHFASALLAIKEKDAEAATIHFGKAEEHFAKAEGNQFYAKLVYRRKRAEFFEAEGKKELFYSEKYALELAEAMTQELGSVSLNMLDEVAPANLDLPMPTKTELESMVKYEGMLFDLKSSRQHMDFLATWQKTIDANDTNIDTTIRAAMRVFQSHYSVDHVLYVWYEGGKPKVLYNNTGIKISSDFIKRLERLIIEDPQGYAVSKVSDSFDEHKEMIEMFGGDSVCSFVSIPFFKKGKLTSFVTIDVSMKDNWHSSLDRYLLNEDDLRKYQLLFRELSYSIKRMEATKKNREMNRKLQSAAVTDVLTGIYNRAGLYEEIRKNTAKWVKDKETHSLGIMFVDMDNFKGYNDTFGHDVGDIILKEMARIFVETVKDYGIVGRYGGDEFVILVTTDDKVVLEGIAQGIYDKIREAKAFRGAIEEYLGHKIKVDKKREISCSIGISCHANIKSEEMVNQLIKEADDVLYMVKTTEKGKYKFL